MFIEEYRIIASGNGTTELILKVVGHDTPRMMNMGTVSEERLNAYFEGRAYGCFQDLFPELSPKQREFIQSDMTQAEWDDLFKEQN